MKEQEMFVVLAKWSKLFKEKEKKEQDEIKTKDLFKKHEEQKAKDDKWLEDNGYVVKERKGGEINE